ncbi:carbohydrate ABC transporter permease [Alkalicoccus saliphilus]|uniref:Sugar ABC transporter permease n=1 Tax=Alkalicoccus saliphilus TaxID=200989 RepID=A0A2T4U6T8_9BACI|nr:sugar ABC transporter permease [Alkalicoccus saliphilus]PTL39109.1 sugar ABC transporter permease [Alkalicoccus saliphilus]
MQKKGIKNRGIGENPIPWFLPLLAVLLLVFVYPIIEIVRFSFTDAGLLDTNYSVTLESYTSLFTSPGFTQMLIITGVFVFFSVTFQMILGLAIALLVDQGMKRKLHGTIVIRTAVLTAWAIPGVIIGIIWMMMYNEADSGVLNYILSSLGIADSVAFLSDPVNALVSVTVANIWRGTAFSMIMIYAGLQTISRDVIEASLVDGANAFKRLFKVIIPILSPVLFVNLIIVTVETFNTFDMVMALTGGGPGRSTEVIALSIYNSIFNQFELGQGAATAVVLLLINALMTVIYFKVLQKNQEVG